MVCFVDDEGGDDHDGPSARFLRARDLFTRGGDANGDGVRYDCAATPRPGVKKFEAWTATRNMWMCALPVSRHSG
jgi:hypothetical protein